MSNTDTYPCPLCSGKLAPHGDRLVCPNGDYEIRAVDYNQILDGFDAIRQQFSDGPSFEQVSLALQEKNLRRTA